MCHLDGVERLGQRTDLVYLDQDRVGATGLDTLLQEIYVGHEQVVAHELAFVADLGGQQLPAFPVVLRHTVLDRVDGVFRYERLEVLDLLLRAALGTLLAFELGVVVHAVGVELRRSAVHADRHIAAFAFAAGLVTGHLDCLEDRLDSVLRTVQRGSETALVTDRRRKVALVEHLLQVVEHLGAHADSLLERGGTHGTDHELLECDRGVRVRTAVDDVHHRDGQRLGVRAADIAVERHAEIVGSGTCNGQRHAEDGVCAELRLGRRTVERDHGLVDTHLVGNVHADDGRGDHLVDILDGVQYALAQVTALIAVAELERFVLARRCAARNGCASECTRNGANFDLDGRIASRVEDFPCVNLYNLHSCKRLNLWFEIMTSFFAPQRYKIIVN